MKEYQLELQRPAITTPTIPGYRLQIWRREINRNISQLDPRHDSVGGRSMSHASANGADFWGCCGRGCCPNRFRPPVAVGFAGGRVSESGVSLSSGEDASGGELRCDTTYCRRSSQIGTSNRYIDGTTM